MKFEDFKPQLACPVELDKVSKYASYTMEVKLDGVRCIAMRDSTGQVTLWTRSGHEMHTKLPHLMHQLKALPGTWVIDGEVGYVQKTPEDEEWLTEQPVAIDFNKTMRVIGSSPAEARLKQNVNRELGMDWMKFIVFDILLKGNYPTSRLSQANRTEELYALFNRKSQDMNDVSISEDWPGWDEEFYNRIVELGGEGIMLKNPDAPYSIGGRRANTWYKVKAFETIDCKITGFDPGQGKYGGQVGALVVQDPAEAEIRISGMADHQRADMTCYFEDKYKDKMCEVKHFGRVGMHKDGYRHPQFLRMRPDLDL